MVYLSISEVEKYFSNRWWGCGSWNIYYQGKFTEWNWRDLVQELPEFVVIFEILPNSRTNERATKLRIADLRQVVNSAVNVKIWIDLHVKILLS